MSDPGPSMPNPIKKGLNTLEKIRAQLAIDLAEVKPDPNMEVLDFDRPILATIIGLPLEDEPESVTPPEEEEPSLDAVIEELDDKSKALLPLLNGQKYIIEIEVDSGYELDEVKRIVKELVLKKVVYMVPKVKADDIFCATLKLGLLFFHGKMQEQCIKFITCRPGPKGKATISQVLDILSGLQYECISMHNLSKKHAHIIGETFDFSRLMTFALLHNLIKSLGSNPNPH